MSFLFSSVVLLPTVLVALVGRHRDDVIGSLVTITPLLSREVVYSLLGISDSMGCGHKSLDDDEAVMDDLGRGAKQLVVQKALLTVLNDSHEKHE